MQMELLVGLVVLVDGAAVHARELGGARDDRAEHGLEIERRAHRLSDFAECLSSPTDLRELGGSRFQFLEQAHVLDGDHRLVGKGLEQFLLRLGNWSGLGPAHDDGTDRTVRRAASARPGMLRKPPENGER